MIFERNTQKGNQKVTPDSTNFFRPSIIDTVAGAKHKLVIKLNKFIECAFIPCGKIILQKII